MNEGRKKTIKYGDKEIPIGFQTPEFGEASANASESEPKPQCAYNSNECPYEGKCGVHKQSPDWEERLLEIAELQLAPTEKYIFDLDALKAFIKEEIQKAEQRGQEVLIKIIEPLLKAKAISERSESVAEIEKRVAEKIIDEIPDLDTWVDGVNVAPVVRSIKDLLRDKYLKGDNE